MIHILSLDDLELGRMTTDTKILLSMFAARKSVFVDLLKWDVPVLDGRYELDQFDDDRATYVVVTDDHGVHRGSARLLPSIRGHILGDLYPYLCDRAVPCGGDIFEITRFCLDRGLRAKARREVRDRLVMALVDHALSRGIRAYTAIAETNWFRQIERFGWDCQALGAPRRVGGQELRAMRIVIDAATPARLRASGMGERSIEQGETGAGIRPAALTDAKPTLGRAA